MWRPVTIPSDLVGMVRRAVQRREKRRIDEQQKIIRLIAEGRWMDGAKDVGSGT